ncbi:MAG: ATP synthase F1 subunit epsilon [Bacteroidetes bacterium]|nr:ATP synthase F1 subunit epsilon [Bacteroidota bacterium]
MQVEILTPAGQVFQGEADLVQLPGVDGLFEVLNNHAPMIAALAAGRIKLAKSGVESFYAVQAGFVEVLKNKVAILVEGAKAA